MFTTTLDTTVGGENSNSYVTLEEAEAYLQYRSDASSFLEMSDESKSYYLIYATLINDTLLYPTGTPTNKDQALLFPRKNLRDAHGKEYSDNAIPNYIKYAQIEQALYLTSNNIKTPSMLQQGFSEARLDVMSIKLDKSFIPSKLDSTAIDFLSLFGVVDNSIGMNVVNIIRY